MRILALLFALGVAMLAPRVARGDTTARERVVVKYWEKWSGFERDAMQAVVDDFNRSQDAIFVDYLSISGVVQKTLIATAGGNPPDIAGLWANDLADFAEKNALEPLDDLAAGTSVRRERYLPIFWDMVVYKGRLFGVPSTPVTIAFYWNKDLFRKAGLDPDKPPTTVAELDAYAQKLTTIEDGRITQMGFVPSEPIWWPHFWPALFGGRLWDGDAKILLESPANIQAFAWAQGYAHRYGVASLQNLSATFGNFASAQDPFMGGRLAMIVQGVWLANYLANYAPQVKFGAAPLPTLRAGDPPMGVADTDLLVIPRGARHRREAFEFMRYFAERGPTEKLALGQQKISPLREQSEQFYREHRHPYIAMFQDLASSPATVPAQPSMSIWQEYRSEIANAFQRVWLLEATPEQALHDASVRVQKSWDHERRRQIAAPSVLLSVAPALLVGLIAVLVAVGAMVERARGVRLVGNRRSARANVSLAKGLLFFSPWGVGLTLFVGLPIMGSLVYAFCDYSVLSTARWVGLLNFVDLLDDEVFWMALRNTLVFVIAALPLGLLLAFFTALLLDANVRGSGVYRTLVFLPSLTPVVATAFVWLWMFNAQYGVVNDVLRKVSFGLIPPVAWLAERRSALPSLIAMSAWGIGQTTVILLAAMQDIPTAMYEAADLDGAGFWHKVRHITLPLTSPVIFFNAIVGIITSLQLFTQPYIMTGGGPARATLTYTMRIYENAFTFLRMGYASAMAWILFVIILGLTALVVRIGRIAFTTPEPEMSASGSPFSSLFRQHPRAKLLVHAVLLATVLLLAFPMLWMVSTALKPIEQTTALPLAWLPHPPQWKNFSETLAYIPFWTYTRNTLVVCVLASIGTTLSSALVAYSFTRLEWPGRDILFALTLATMMVPFPVLMVPLYGMFKSLGWMGTLKPLWVPSFFGSAFNIFLLRQFFLRIPKSLPEAMTLDGASELRVFVAIYLPLSKAPLAVAAFFQFIYSWNDFLGQMLFLTDQDTFTLTVGLQFYQNQLGGTQWHYLMAAAVLMTLPILAVFFLLQRTFLQGLSFMSNIDA